MRRYLLLIASCILCFTGSALCQGLSIKSAELSVSAGESNFSAKTFSIGPPQTSTPITGNMKLNSGLMYESRINFFTTAHWGSEVFYGYQYGGVSFNRTAPTTGTFSVPLQIHTLGLNILYYPVGTTKSAWRPFVTLGGGAVIYRPSTGGAIAAKDPLQGNFDTFFESSRPGGNAGGGIKRTLTKSIGVRADVGVALTKVPTFGLPESSAIPNSSVLPVGGLVRTFRASAGLIFYLGR